MAQKDGNDKVSIIFIKGNDPKKVEIVKHKEAPTVKIKFTNKKWEPKKGGNPKDLELLGNVPKRLDDKIPKVISKLDKNHPNSLNILDK